MPSARPARPIAEPQPSRWQVSAVIAGTVVVGAVLAADTQGALRDSRTLGTLLAIGGAAVAAGATYAFWGGAPVRTLRMHVALFSAMLAGASVAGSATSGVDRVFYSPMMALLGIAGFVIALIALLAQVRVAGVPQTPGRADSPSTKNRKPPKGTR